MDLEMIFEFAKGVLTGDVTGHDWQHALRVEKNALKICPESVTKEDLEVIQAASWLHDTIDDKVDESKRKTVAEVEQLLVESGATTGQRNEILHIIQNLSYSKNLAKKQKLSALGEIVQDADRLDALGAIGIARAFYYGGHRGQPLYDEMRPRLLDELTEETYREGSTVINHFFEKLLLLENSMNTLEGSTEAIIRTRFIREFLEQFYNEINGFGRE